MVNYRRLEKERVNALWSRDAVTCVQKYYELGIDLDELPELKELAEAERIFNSEKSLEKSVIEPIKKITKRKRTVPDIQYKSFYNEASNLSLEIGIDSDRKRFLLARYFPGRFGDEGRQPVCNMNYLSAGDLFRKIVEYSEKRINQ